jgi:hypothetical protein
VEAHWHVLETTVVFFGSNFVQRAFFEAGALLSDRIYKICTRLSTGFVEKIAVARTAPARKPLPDADFRGALANA